MSPVTWFFIYRHAIDQIQYRLLRWHKQPLPWQPLLLNRVSCIRLPLDGGVWSIIDEFQLIYHGMRANIGNDGNAGMIIAMATTHVRWFRIYANEVNANEAFPRGVAAGPMASRLANTWHYLRPFLVTFISFRFQPVLHGQLGAGVALKNPSPRIPTAQESLSGIIDCLDSLFMSELGCPSLGGTGWLDRRWGRGGGWLDKGEEADGWFNRTVGG